MARKAQPTDFPVTVEGVGTFVFAKRTMRDEIAIQVEFARIIDGVEPTAWLETVGGWFSVLRVLTVRAPDGWDFDALDPLDNDTYRNLGRLHDGLVTQERSFRQGTKPDGQTSGVGPA